MKIPLYYENCDMIFRKILTFSRKNVRHWYKYVSCWCNGLF